MSNTKGKRIFIYRLSPETFGYTLLWLLKPTHPPVLFHGTFIHELNAFTQHPNYARFLTGLPNPRRAVVPAASREI